MPFIPNKTKADKFIQLPNGDLWLGRRDDEVQRPDTLTNLVETPESVVMSMLRTARGGPLNCPHCGQQFSSKELNEAREHVEKLHPSAETPLKNADVILAQGGDIEGAEFLGAVVLDKLD